MSARLEAPLALALSIRAGARALHTRPATLADLIRRRIVRTVPWGAGRRIPLEEIERLAREGWTLDGLAPRRRARVKPGRCDPDALRALDVSSLRGEP